MGLCRESVLNNNTHLLKSAPLFRSLSDKDIELLHKYSVKRQYEKGEVVCRKDSPADSVFMIMTGTVSEIAIDGNDFSTIAVSKKRFDYFGELGVLLEDYYTTTVVVTSQAIILSIPAEVFRKILWANPSSMKVILGLFRTGLQNSAEKFISCTMFNMEGRLAHMLLQMQSDDTDRIPILITQEDLSYHCGISRQTVSSILNRWKKQELIDIQRGQISILSAGGLTDILMKNAKIY